MDPNSMNQTPPDMNNSYIVALAPIEMDPIIYQLINPILKQHGYEPINWLHITLAICRKEELIPSICEKLNEISTVISPFSVQIECFYKFSKQHVLCLRVNKTPRLIYFRTQILNIINKIPVLTKLSNWYWIPHISILYTLNNDYKNIYMKLVQHHVNNYVTIKSFSIRDLFSYEKIIPLESSVHYNNY